MRNPYYAVVYAYDRDGTEKAYMPCYTHEQMMARAARYDEVRVVMFGKPSFKLKLKDEERKKYPIPVTDDVPLEWTRDFPNLASFDLEVISEHVGPQSDLFYDSWRGMKKDPRW